MPNPTNPNEANGFKLSTCGCGHEFEVELRDGVTYVSCPNEANHADITAKGRSEDVTTYGLDASDFIGGPDEASLQNCNPDNSIISKSSNSDTDEAEDAERKLHSELLSRLAAWNAQEKLHLHAPELKRLSDYLVEYWLEPLFEAQKQKWVEDAKMKIPNLKIYDGTESEPTKFYNQGFNEVVAAWRAALRGKS